MAGLTAEPLMSEYGIADDLDPDGDMPADADPMAAYLTYETRLDHPPFKGGGEARPARLATHHPERRIVGYGWGRWGRRFVVPALRDHSFFRNPPM
jgi:hypothetical protein